MPPTNADYAKINIACKELGLDKHQLLSDRYKIESSKQLTAWQLADLYKHFKGLGWRVKHRKQSSKSPKYDDRQHRKIVAMWITLSQRGSVRDGSDLALQSFVKNRVGIDNLKWCGGTECYRLIEILKDWCIREGIDVENY